MSTPDGELGIRVHLDDAKAYEEGGTGWGHGRGRFEMDGKSVGVRVTGVVHREDGEWKVVQSHASIGVPERADVRTGPAGGAGARPNFVAPRFAGAVGLRLQLGARAASDGVCWASTRMVFFLAGELPLSTLSLAGSIDRLRGGVVCGAAATA